MSSSWRTGINRDDPDGGDVALSCSHMQIRKIFSIITSITYNVVESKPERHILSIVVPVFNEEESIGILYREFLPVLTSVGMSWELIFIDDGSTDHTPHRLSELKEGDNRVRVIGFDDHVGLSAALEAGFRSCVGDVVITLDGDLQYDPEDIPRFLEELRSCDVVCGWRRQRKDTLDRRCLSFLAFITRRIVLGDPIHDSGCTFRAYRRHCVSDLFLPKGYHRFIPYLLQAKGYRVREIEVNHHPRRFGSSSYGLSRVGKGMKDLLHIRREHRLRGR